MERRLAAVMATDVVGQPLRAMRSLAMAAALGVSVLSGAAAQTPVEPRMVAIEGGA